MFCSCEEEKKIKATNTNVELVLTRIPPRYIKRTQLNRRKWSMGQWWHWNHDALKSIIMIRINCVPALTSLLAAMLLKGAFNSGLPRRNDDVKKRRKLPCFSLVHWSEHAVRLHPLTVMPEENFQRAEQNKL